MHAGKAWVAIATRLTKAIIIYYVVKYTETCMDIVQNHILALDEKPQAFY